MFLPPAHDIWTPTSPTQTRSELPLSWERRFTRHCSFSCQPVYLPHHGSSRLPACVLISQTTCLTYGHHLLLVLAGLLSCVCVSFWVLCLFRMRIYQHVNSLFVSHSLQATPFTLHISLNLTPTVDIWCWGTNPHFKMFFFFFLFSFSAFFFKL